MISHCPGGKHVGLLSKADNTSCTALEEIYRSNIDVAMRNPTSNNYLNEYE